MEYQEEDYLQLSGLQHFAFCRRQWALIYIEKQWADNYHTADGNIMHAKAHDAEVRESRGDIVITRCNSIFSAELGVSGQCDVLEFHRSASGIPLPNRHGYWQPYPVEYKRGHPKEINADRLQLCGQAMCLETMLCCDIPEGAIYYGQTKHREVVPFTDNLRNEVKVLLSEMHELYAKKYTPKVKPSSKCGACSLKEICLPELQKAKSVAKYLRTAMEDTP